MFLLHWAKIKPDFTKVKTKYAINVQEHEIG